MNGITHRTPTLQHLIFRIITLINARWDYSCRGVDFVTEPQKTGQCQVVCISTLQLFSHCSYNCVNTLRRSHETKKNKKNSLLVHNQKLRTCKTVHVHETRGWCVISHSHPLWMWAYSVFRLWFFLTKQKFPPKSSKYYLASASQMLLFTVNTYV